MPWNGGSRPLAGARVDTTRPNRVPTRSEAMRRSRRSSAGRSASGRRQRAGPASSADAAHSSYRATNDERSSVPISATHLGTTASCPFLIQRFPSKLDRSARLGDEVIGGAMENDEPTFQRPAEPGDQSGVDGLVPKPVADRDHSLSLA